MPPVESSAIHSIRYDEKTRALFVIFSDGDLYRYSDVPPDLYREFLTADSKGRFFAGRIRNRFAYAFIKRHSPA